ncbi:MAG: bifunctional NAD(P)H-hydrate repair enzyme [Bacteroidia bacterium]|nr:MAG: bifunctional NAD(P)H-hydrate repair enzyme [Bacteroidia bacterium]
MKILSATQIKQVDNCSILKQNITSWELMERAASRFVENLLPLLNTNTSVYIFCGKGNNGGDGLAIARMLSSKNFSVHLFIIQHTSTASNDFLINLEKIKHCNLASFKEIFSINDLSDISINDNHVCIDAILGSGVNKPTSGILQECIHFINQKFSSIISVDVPSGLFLDIPNSPNDSIIKATHTFTFQMPKLSFFFPENNIYVGSWKIIDIELSQECIDEQATHFFTIDSTLIRKIYQKRNHIKSKWDFGHTLLIAGSYQMPGAALLCTNSALRSGCGLVTLHSIASVVSKAVQRFPECILSVDSAQDYIQSIPKNLNRYTSIAIGCGIGKNKHSHYVLSKLLQSITNQKLVIDADGLNTIANDVNFFLPQLPSHQTILTPHIKEFDRIFGHHTTHFDRIQTALRIAQEKKIVIVLKSPYTAVILPSGQVYFNTIANSGLAKGGSGDVLAGLIAGLCAKSYSIENAALLGVYIHSIAAKKAIENFHPATLLPSDVVQYFSSVFYEVENE